MDLADKISKIEALIAGTSSDGERKAAELAKQRLQEKTAAQPIEYSVRVDGLWKKKLFMAICQKYGLSTYRYSGQKRTTAMVRVSKSFMDQILWPEYNRHAQAFDEFALEIMSDLIAKIHQVNDNDEVEIAGVLPASTVAAAL
jgi:hypothetical protein